MPSSTREKPGEVGPLRLLPCLYEPHFPQSFANLLLVKRKGDAGRTLPIPDYYYPTIRLIAFKTPSSCNFSAEIPKSECAHPCCNSLSLLSSNRRIDDNINNTALRYCLVWGDVADSSLAYTNLHTAHGHQKEPYRNIQRKKIQARALQLLHSYNRQLTSITR